MSGLFRTLLFVPGNNPRFVKKAGSVPADVVCLDLEDSVPAAQKDAARGIVRESLGGYGGESSVYVRINPIQSGYAADDLDAVVRGGIDGIVVPKVCRADEVRALDADLARLEERRGLPRTLIMPSIESAEGVVNCYDIATSSRRVAAVVFGIFDLLNDLGVEYSAETSHGGYSRAKVPVDARGAGLPAIDSVWQDIRDAEGFERDCGTGKSLGYSGKCVIHPSQVGAAHKTFRPSAAEVRWAGSVRRAYEESIAAGRGATTVDGRMIDEVHYKRAGAVLDWQGRYG